MDIRALRAFAAIVEEGSFTAAARRLRLSKVMCNKLISDPEADLGARLLVRTTRAVRPNGAGAAFFAEIAGILAACRASTQRPSGPLKLSAPVHYMLNVFQPHLLRFMREYPDIRLKTVLEDSRADLVRDGFDAIIRIGPLDDRALHVCHLHDVPITLVVSPAHIRDHGAPAHPAERRDHACRHYSNLHGSNTWPLSINGEVSYHKIKPDLFQQQHRIAAPDGAERAGGCREAAISGRERPAAGSPAARDDGSRASARRSMCSIPAARMSARPWRPFRISSPPCGSRPGPAPNCRKRDLAAWPALRRAARAA
ncbi:LysR family transcriptional regulator [Paracoccus bogoriensis]|nr:LysR family transcriptional regulator [Paracoccus bogoriensis]MBW7057428.1 LysR family transcriptional regulator [Paracoccus bogoriensis]